MEEKNKPILNGGLSFKVYFLIICIGAILGYRQYFTNQKKFESSLTTSGERKSPNKIVVESPIDIFTGDCVKMTITARDEKGQEFNGNDIFLSGVDSINNALTLFNGPACSVEDQPLLELLLTKGERKKDFYTIITRPGRVLISAHDGEGKSVVVESLMPLDIKINIHKIKLSFKSLPPQLSSYQKFSVSIGVEDMSGNLIPNTIEKVRLFLIQKEAVGEDILLGESTVTNGLATFVDVMLPEVQSDSGRFMARLEQTTELSAFIEKEKFTPVSMIVDIEGMQKFHGVITQPGHIDVLGRSWKFDLHDKDIVVDIGGQQYRVEPINSHYVRLRKK
jgi:hypothetical protein